MADDKLDQPVKVHTSRELKIEIGVSAQVFHVTPEAARMQIEIAQARVAIAQAKHVQPVRIVMRYMLLTVSLVLIFMLTLALLTKVVGLDTLRLPPDAWTLLDKLAPDGERGALIAYLLRREAERQGVAA